MHVIHFPASQPFQASPSADRHEYRRRRTACGPTNGLSASGRPQCDALKFADRTPAGPAHAEARCPLRRQRRSLRVENAHRHRCSHFRRHPPWRCHDTQNNMANPASRGVTNQFAGAETGCQQPVTHAPRAPPASILAAAAFNNHTPSPVEAAKIRYLHHRPASVHRNPVSRRSLPPSRPRFLLPPASVNRRLGASGNTVENRALIALTAFISKLSLNESGAITIFIMSPCFLMLFNAFPRNKDFSTQALPVDSHQ